MLYIHIANFFENCESEDLIDSHDDHPAVTAKPIQCTGPVYTPFTPYFPSPNTSAIPYTPAGCSITHPAALT
ncbi:MAG: hypothetical protein MIO93_11170, partial [ANME-2 cluster archaeon]|nr:hypothetical protein [ANME-2 cluster archaeon]